MNISVYEELRFPKRSEFYHLEPIGVDTPFVESSSSYTARLAKEHFIPPVALLRRATLLRSNLTPFLSSFWHYHKLIVGTGKIAASLYEALELLTWRRDLRWTTMVTWKDVLPVRSLIRSTRAWCSLCYEDWLNSKAVMYDPLLWTLSAVTVCPIHKILLSTSCPTCNSQILHIHARYKPGFCTQCRSWLGAPHSVSDSTVLLDSGDDAKWQLWKAESVGRLLAQAPHVDPPTRDQVAKSLKYCIDRFSSGRAARFASTVMLSGSSFASWLEGRKIPTLDNVLQITFRADIPTLNFLCGTLQATNSSSLGEQGIGQWNIDSVKKEVPFSTDKMLSTLTLAASSDERPPLQALVRLTGWKRKKLEKDYPALCRAIIDRYAEVHRKQLDEAKVLPVLRAALRKIPPPSLEVLARRIGCPPSSLAARFPDLIRKLRARSKKFLHGTDWDLVEKRLLEVLSLEHALSLRKIAYSIGKSTNTLVTRFPEITTKIVKRFKEYTQSRIADRKEQLRLEISEIVESLEVQGIYPSVTSVEPRVKTHSNSHEIHLILKKVREEYRAATASETSKGSI